MDWRDILKVDRFIFDNTKNAPSGYYNPREDEVTLNLSAFSGDDSKIIDDISTVAFHEYAHKAVHPEVKPIYDRLSQAYIDSIVAVLFGEQPMRVLGEAVDAFGEIMALDEAFAYASQYNVNENTQINIDASVIFSLKKAYTDIATSIIEDVRRQAPEILPDMIQNAKNTDDYIHRRIVPLAVKIENITRRFLAQNPTDPAKRKELLDTANTKGKAVVDMLREVSYWILKHLILNMKWIWNYPKNHFHIFFNRFSALVFQITLKNGTN